MLGVSTHYPVREQQQYDHPSSPSLGDPFGGVFDEGFNFDDTFQDYETDPIPGLMDDQGEM
jgi:hypothetical protein